MTHLFYSFIILNEDFIQKRNAKNDYGLLYRVVGKVNRFPDGDHTTEFFCDGLRSVNLRSKIDRKPSGL